MHLNLSCWTQARKQWLSCFFLVLSLSTIVQTTEHPEKFVCEPNNQNHNYLNWINELSTRKQYFEIEVEVVEVASQQTNYVHERIDFDQKLSKLTFSRFENERQVKRESLFQSSISEINTITGESYVCESQEFTEHVARKFANYWVPEQVYSIQTEAYRKAIGPTSLLFHLIADLDKTHSYRSKDPSRESYVYNLCFSQHMVKYAIIRSSDQILLKNIRLYQRLPNSKYILARQFNFFQQVITSKPNADQKLSPILPVGYGCHRVHAVENAVPSHTKFGQQGDFSYELVQFKPEPGNSDESSRSVDDERILFDRVHKFSVFESRTKASRQLLVQDTQTMYTVNEQTGECVAQSVVDLSDAVFDLSNIRQLFVFYPALFESNSDYQDMGDRYERDVLCSVREIVTTLIPSKNSLNAKVAVVTHFVPKESFFTINDATVKVPISIRIAYFAEPERIQQLAVYTLNINLFDESLDHTSLLDLSGCALHTYDYTWIQLRMPADPNEIDQIRYAQRQLQHEIRNALAVSAIRLPTVDVRFEATAVYVTFKLLEDPGVLQYFEKKWHQSLLSASKRMPADSEHLCARQCFRLAKCAAFAHCSSLECDLFLDPEFVVAYDQTQDRLDYDHDMKVKTSASNQCNVFRRNVALKSGHDSHLDNRRLITRWQAMVDESKFKIQVPIDFTQQNKVNLIVDMLGVDVKPGRLLDSNDEDDADNRWNAELEDERNVERYDQLFTITQSNHVFQTQSLKDANLKYRELLWLSLYECQLACVNEPHCASYSYCETYRKCVLSELLDASKIDQHSEYDAKCMLSSKKLLASFQIYESRSLSVDPPVTLKSDTNQDLDPEQCAYMCLNNKDVSCSSFDFCEGVTENGVSKSTCHLHDVHLISLESDKSIHWKVSETHCDHYAKLHTFDYKEYYGESLKETDLGDFEQVSVEKCAALCSDTLDCSTFDYCLNEPDEHEIETTTCRLNSGMRISSNVQPKRRSCSVYERTGPSRGSRKHGQKSTSSSPPQKQGYTKGAVAGLSVLFLFVGLVIGALLSHFVLDKYLRL